MRYAILLLTLFLLAVPAAQAGADAPALVERPDWQAHFDAAGVTGVMVIQKEGSPQILVSNAKRAATPYLPASTFKILNALIALDCGAVSGPDEVFPYDGQPRFLPEWNADLTLRQAFALSCVPVYQDIARRIGPTRMAKGVAAAGYGNADITGGIDRFWLEGGLRISALEQVAFLGRLNRHALPFNKDAMDTVLALMTVEQTPDHALLAKTGWATRATPQIGWYVGMVKRGPDTFSFALNIDIASPEQAKSRQTIARAILQAEGIL
ncbi:class D beta-lactamase [Solidesulfovibrio sp.]